MNDQNQKNQIEAAAKALQASKDEAARNMRRYMMDKQTFVCCGYNKYIMEVREPKTHIEVTWEQMAFVAKDKAANGPKIIHFLATMYGIPDADRRTAEMAMLRGEQERIDKGGDKYVPPAEEVKEPVKEPVAELKPEAERTDANAAIADLRATLTAMETKEAVLAHAETVFGIKLDLDKRIGKERAIEAVVAAMQARSEAAVKTA